MTDTEEEPPSLEELLNRQGPTMKLLICRVCADIFRLRSEERTCSCGATKGMYLNICEAEYSGPAIPLGFANGSLVDAIRNQPEGPGWGADFKAFVIPKNCATFVKTDADKES